MCTSCGVVLYFSFLEFGIRDFGCPVVFVSGRWRRFGLGLGLALVGFGEAIAS